MILVIDNYDSFVHNLARYIRELGWATDVVRNDAIDLAGIAARRPSHIVISPGPCTPNEAGISVALIERFGRSTPILGVCLGHQCIGQAFGGKVVRARRPMLARAYPPRQSDVFAGCPIRCAPRAITRWWWRRKGCRTIAITAESAEGEMALRHRRWPVVGLQFHPEAVLTEHGPICCAIPGAAGSSRSAAE
jgi:anthranilate synthase/aminodeoxychorismate synthase-like glutamine amidotransferase